MALSRILRQVISLNKKGKTVNTVGVYLAETADVYLQIFWFMMSGIAYIFIKSNDQGTCETWHDPSCSSSKMKIVSM